MFRVFKTRTQTNAAANMDNANASALKKRRYVEGA